MAVTDVAGEACICLLASLACFWYSLARRACFKRMVCPQGLPLRRSVSGMGRAIVFSVVVCSWECRRPVVGRVGLSTLSVRCFRSVWGIVPSLSLFLVRPGGQYVGVRFGGWVQSGGPPVGGIVRYGLIFVRQCLADSQLL